MRPGMLLTLVATWAVVMTLTQPIAAAVQTSSAERGAATATYPVLKIEGKPKVSSQEAWQSAEAATRLALIEYRQSANLLQRVPQQKLRPLLARYWKVSEKSEWYAEPVGRQMYTVEVRLPLSARLLQELDDLEQEEGRKYLAHQRVMVLGKVLAGLVLLLTATTCYFRLDEWTKGYYTTLLRLGAAGFVGTGVAGLVLIA